MMTGRTAALPLLCALFVVLWSSGFVGAKFGLDYAGTFTILFWRYALVVAVLGLIVTITGKWQWIPRRTLFRHMAVGALAHAAWLVSVLSAIDLGLSAGLAAFITALQPILTGGLSARLTGERVTAREWAGLVLGLLAVAVVIGDGISIGGSPVAYLLPFVAVIAITLASLIDRNATVDGGNDAPLVLVTFWHCVSSLMVLTPFAIGLEGLKASWSGGLVFAIIWLAMVVSLAAYGLMFALLRLLPAARVASLTYLSPPVTMVMAWMLFGEKLSIASMIGLGLAAISVGLTLTARGERIVSEPMREPSDRAACLDRAATGATL